MADFSGSAVTFLFTDIEKSTELWDDHEEAMRVALARHDRLLDDLIAHSGGAVFKRMGDSICATFERSRAALDAALAIQRTVQSAAWGEIGELRVRIALHVGEAEQRDGDYFGLPVIRVARLLATAAGGEILASETLVQFVEHQLPAGVSTVSLGERALRGIREPMRVFRIVSSHDVGERAPAPSVSSGATSASRPAPPADEEHDWLALAAPPAGSLRVATLGTFQVEWNGMQIADDAWNRRPARQLFKVLVTRPSHRIGRERIEATLWPDSAPETAHGLLRGAVHALRRYALASIGHPDAGSLVISDPDGVALPLDGRVWVDADAFEQLARRAEASDAPDTALEAAIALYRGEYLPDDLYEDWAAERREALKQTAQRMRFALAERKQRAGDLAAAIAAIQPLVTADLCDEPAARELMRLLGRQGRRSEAIRVFQRLERALADDLGVEPSPETLDLRRQIADGHASDGPIARTRTPASAPASAPDGAGDATGRAPFARRPQAMSFITSYPMPTPVRLVGRARELTAAERMFARLSQRDRADPRLLLIGAPAGTGKSSLLGALIPRARAAGVLCLVGGAYADQGVGPFSDALAELLLSQPPGPLLADLAGFASDLAGIVPELRWHLGLADAPAPGQDRDLMRMFGAVHAYLRSLAEHGPVLLALEDIHTAVAPSLQLVRYLLRHMRNLPLLLVGTYRSDEIATNGPLAEMLAWLDRERLGERWLLDPLDRDQTADLTSALLDGAASPRLVEALHTATGGNPLFVEQFVLALKEAGRLERRAGQWDGAMERGDALPRVVRNVLGQRFGRLSGTCRDTLAMASVLGQTVPYRTLLEASESGDEAALLADLEEALEARLLIESPAGYSFAHALLREAVYASLRGPARMRLHRRAGETLERLGGDRALDRPTELAHHFAQAGASPAVVAKALQYNLAAGRRHAAVSAHQQAFTFFGRVAALMEAQGSDADRAVWVEALEGRANAERALWLWMPLIEDAQRILALADEPAQKARAHSAIGFARQQTGDTIAALAEYEAGLRDLDAAGDDSGTVVARLRLQVEQAYIWFLQGKFVAMLAQAERILAVAVELGQPRPLFWAHNIVALAHFGSGQVGRAVEQFQQACEAAARTEDRIDLAIAHSNLGLQYYFGGQYPQARTELERAIGLYRDATADRRTANPLQSLGRVWLAQGDVEQAREYAELASAVAADVQDRWAADCYDLLGMIHATRTEWDAAESQFRRAATAREHVDYAHGKIESVVGFGLVCQRRGDWQRARECYEQAVGIAATMDPNPWAIGAWRHLGRLLYLMGELNRAVPLLERALVTAEQMPESVEYAPTLLASAKLNWRRDPLIEVRERVEGIIVAGMSVERTAEAHIVAAELARLLGDRDAARAHLASALALGRRLGSPFVVGRVALEAGRLERDSAAIAAEHFETACRIFGGAGLPFEHALALLERGRAHDGGVSGRARAPNPDLDEARQVFMRLGARIPDAEREPVPAAGGSEAGRA